MKLVLNICSVPGPVLSTRNPKVKSNLVPALKGLTLPLGTTDLNQQSTQNGKCHNSSMCGNIRKAEGVT